METLQFVDSNSSIPSLFGLNTTNFKMTNADTSSHVQNSDSDSNNRLPTAILPKPPNHSFKHVHVLQCPGCQFSTLISLTLQGHIKANHPTIDSFTAFSCSDCGAKTTEKNLLEDHMKLYHPNAEQPYKFLELRHSVTSIVDGVPLASPRSTVSSTISTATAQTVRLESSSPPIITSPQKSTITSHALAKAECATEVTEKFTNAIQGSKKRKAHTPGKITPAALPVNGDAEDSVVETEYKRIKLDKSPEPNVEIDTKLEGTNTSQSEITSNATSTTMVCTVNGFMEALKNRQQLVNAQQNATAPKITTTSIMMDSNVAKNLVNQLLASAQGKIEVGTSPSSSTNQANLSVDQALDMSMRSTLEQGLQLQAGLKTSELKLSDLIQTNQFNLRGLLGGQSTVATTTLGTPGVQQITIGLPASNTPTSQTTSILDPEVLKQLQSSSQMVSLSQLQALLSLLGGGKPIVQTPKEISTLDDILTSQMLLQGSSSLVSGSVSGISLPLEGLSSSTLNLPTTAGLTLTGNTLKGYPFSTGGLIPVTNFSPGQTGGLGTFSLANSTLPSSLAGFVTSLSGASQATQAISTSSGQPTIATTQNLPFDGSIFLNQLNQATTATTQANLQIRPPIQAVATNGGNHTSVTMVTSDNNSPQVGLRVSKSNLSLDDLATTDTDNSVVGGGAGMEENVEKESDSSPSTSQAGSRRPKSGGRRSSGVGSRPHRQNFTANQNRILNDWYNEHHYKPYPSTEDTKHLSNLAGLTYSQVKKWFANKRARTSSNGVPRPLPPTSQETAPVSSTDTTVAAALSAARTAAAASLLALTTSATTSTSIPLQAVSQAPMSSIIVPSGLMLRQSGLTVLAPRPPTTQETSIVSTTTESLGDETANQTPTSPANEEATQPAVSPVKQEEGNEEKTASD
nr:homeobox protein extradenticle [Hymenolepis microstoma]